MQSEKRTSPFLVVLAWVLANFPAPWGIYNTSVNASKLSFNSSNRVATHESMTRGAAK